MEESTTREKILKKIRSALLHKTDNPYPNIDFESEVYQQSEESLDIAFAEELLNVSGNFIYCESEGEFAENLKELMTEHEWYNVFCTEEKLAALLDRSHIPFVSGKEDFLEMEVGLTSCEFLVARLGSVLVSSRQKSGRRNFVYPPVHLVFAYASQIVPDLKQALQAIKEKYQDKMPSMISLITGPSRTADIEKTLILGAHGPKELYVFMVDDLIQAD
jgi:L-lactate dehydrogenase complex protein LldG